MLNNIFRHTAVITMKGTCLDEPLEISNQIENSAKQQEVSVEACAHAKNSSVGWC